MGTDSGTVTQNDSSAPIDTGMASDDGGTIGHRHHHQWRHRHHHHWRQQHRRRRRLHRRRERLGSPRLHQRTKQSVCSTADVSAAVAACFGSGGTQAGCQAWQTANAACAACAVPPNAADGGDPTANSAIICIDSVGECFVNTAGCVQVKDGNDTCASALQELNFCEFAACDSMSCVGDLAAQDPTGAFAACQTAADSLACMTQLAAANTACTGNDIADGGTLQYCQAQTVADVTRVIYEICGNGQ